MQVFLTSATGYVGAAVAAALRARGHAVAALARSASSEARLRSTGIRPVPGELARPETYFELAASSDAIVHTAFEYAPDGTENLELDMQAARALSRAQRLIYTSNAYLPGIESERLPDTTMRMTDRRLRFETERTVLAANRGTNAVIRLGMVYGGHGGGTISSLFAAAQRSGRLICPAEASDNRWSLIDLHDMASLYVALVETSASGVFHAVDGRPLTVQRVLECVGRACGVPIALQNEAGTRDVLDPHAIDVMKRDVALDSPRARALRWSPRHPDFAAGVTDAYGQWSTQEARIR